MQLQIFKKGFFTGVDTKAFDAFVDSHVVITTQVTDHGDVYVFYRSDIGRRLIDRIELLSEIISKAQGAIISEEIGIIVTNKKLAGLAENVPPTDSGTTPEQDAERRALTRQNLMSEATIAERKLQIDAAAMEIRNLQSPTQSQAPSSGIDTVI